MIDSAPENHIREGLRRCAFELTMASAAPAAGSDEPVESDEYECLDLFNAAWNGKLDEAKKQLPLAKASGVVNKVCKHGGQHREDGGGDMKLQCLSQCHAHHACVRLADSNGERFHCAVGGRLLWLRQDCYIPVGQRCFSSSWKPSRCELRK